MRAQMEIKMDHQTKIKQKEIKHHSFLKMNKKTTHLLLNKFRNFAEVFAYKKMVQWLMKKIVICVEYGLDAKKPNVKMKMMKNVLKNATITWVNL